jgi:hypothetical protein
MVPGPQPIRFGATLIGGRGASPAGGLIYVSQGPASARAYPVTTSGPSSIDVVSQGSIPFVATQRAVGVGNDDASTGGVGAPASGWVVLPAIAGEPAKPGLVLVNPGKASVTVTLHALAASGRTPPADATLTIPPGSVVQAPAAFLNDVLVGSVQVRSAGGGVIAMAASTSLGVKGIATYALSMGAVIPTG